MTDVNISFTLDCAGHGVLTIENHDPQALSGGFAATADWQQAFTIPAHQSQVFKINYNANLHDVTGKVSGTFLGGVVPHWHPSNEFSAHNSEVCGVQQTIAPPTTAGAPVPTTPQDSTPTTATTAPATTTTAPIWTVTGPPASTPVDATTTIPVETSTTQPRALPPTGSGLVAPGLGLGFGIIGLAVAALYVGRKSKRQQKAQAQ